MSVIVSEESFFSIGVMLPDVIGLHENLRGVNIVDTVFFFILSITYGRR